jgi:hypothetical protein
MRGTTIIYAHPQTLAILSEEYPLRFSATRHGFWARVYAAWLVFSGQADAITWLDR